MSHPCECMYLPPPGEAEYGNFDRGVDCVIEHSESSRHSVGFEQWRICARASRSSSCPTVRLSVLMNSCFIQPGPGAVADEKNCRPDLPPSLPPSVVSEGQNLCMPWPLITLFDTAQAPIMSSPHGPSCHLPLCVCVCVVSAAWLSWLS